MGGRDLPGGETSSNVWSSLDGIEWTLEGEAGWSPRVCHGYAVFRGRIWIMGGVSDWKRDNQETLKNDIWFTADGRDWTEVKCAKTWSRRHQPATYVFRDRIWIAGGHAEPVNSEVWSWQPPQEWSF
ncbi:MAG: hypothetical protein GX595_14420 [Lentisphaerae bacterium]|nr:hypothetical protein [Lentisphaerota bacterium]